MTNFIGTTLGAAFSSSAVADPTSFPITMLVVFVALFGWIKLGEHQQRTSRT